MPADQALVYGSVCSGIEAATVAWHPLGWRAAFLSEVAPFPRAVLTHHYPQVPLRGDFTQIAAGDHDPIDVLVGGTPCQSFSVAGLRAGLADARGNLALEYLRLADRLRPRWVVWENVPGVLSSNGGRDFGSFLGGLVKLGYRFAYRVLDAQFFGLAQRRKRVFVVGRVGDWRGPTAVLLERSGLRGDPPPRRDAGERASPTLSSRTTAGGGLGTDHDVNGGLIMGDDVARCLTAKKGYRSDGESETFVAHTLRGTGFDASEDGTGRGTPIVPTQIAPTLRAMPGQGPGRMADDAAAMSMVRRLTPTECERLQGFPDGYTLVPYRGKPAADGPRYQALGNSMAVPVMAWIGRRIQMVENQMRRVAA